MHVYVPKDYRLDIVSRHAGRLVPCISIHPDRRDRVDELDRCYESYASYCCRTPG